MYVMLAWFSEDGISEDARREAQLRFDKGLAEVVPESYRRHDFGSDDWGVTVLYPSSPGSYRWPMVATEGGVTAVSLGLPVGLDVSGGPVSLARRLLAGEDVHREVVPPFGLMALDENGTVMIQQDWIGMCRIFTGSSGGVTAFCSRPTLLAKFLPGDVRPDLDGWASYTLAGNFGGDRSPVAGVRLLAPGERVTVRRRAGQGWELARQIRYATDDVVAEGQAAEGRPLAESFELAAHAITSSVASMQRLWDDEITLGLSGGKDSRLIAAAMIAAGMIPKFATNEDTAAEGEVARQLVQILRDKRGLQPKHQLRRAGAPARVLATGLRERGQRLQRMYDYQFPSTYLVRPAVSDRLAERPRSASITGGAGELATEYWYPPADDDSTPEQAATSRLFSAVPPGVAAESIVTAEHARVSGLLDHGRDLGLHDLRLVDYLYLVERVRRWYTSAYEVGMVTPFLSPGFVTATFALTPQQKRDRLLHTSLIERLVPEWAGIPFVSVNTGPSTATRIWQGDGLKTMADLLDTARGPLTELVNRPAVEEALRTAARRGRSNPRTLQQFTLLALASHQLEADSVQPSTGAAYERIASPPAPRQPAKGTLGGRLRWIKRLPLGNHLISAVRRVRPRRPSQ
ncbi:hypothetical protein ACH4OY_26595 [Micromonospora rubida]|uniref:Asparagine synthetase domain-containing protein n=1 Tax=Micromonospora rubida TaxID=2697657 RepID=A0ABW7STP7_9ACTN